MLKSKAIPNVQVIENVFQIWCNNGKWFSKKVKKLIWDHHYITSRQQISWLFLTHPPYVTITNTERRKKLSISWRHEGMVPILNKKIGFPTIRILDFQSQSLILFR